MKFIILLTIVAVCASQQLPDKTKWTALTCQDGNFKPNADRTKEIRACGPKCTFFCHAKALGLLNSNGLPSEETGNTWIDATFPEQHKAYAKTLFADCYQKYGKFIDLNDSECRMAKLYGNCTWGVVPGMTCPK